MVLSYLLSHAAYRIAVFFRRWYVDFSRRWWARTVDQFLVLDRSFALKVMTRMWLHPLYGDYTVIGKIIGPLFRTGRIVVALAVYAVFFLFAFTFWTIWLSIPVYIISRIILG